MADPEAKAAMEALASERVATALEPQHDLLEDLVGLPTNHAVERARAAREERERRAGRPAGARNKRSEDVARHVVERIGDPLLMLAQLAMMPAEELAKAAGCKVHEALVEKRLAAMAVLPYLHRRMPLAVDLTSTRVVHLTIGDGPAAAAAAGDAALTILGSSVEIVENQEVNDAPDPAV